VIRTPGAPIARAVGKLGWETEALFDAKHQALLLLTGDTALLKPFYDRLRAKDADERKRGVVAFRFLQLDKAPSQLIAMLGDADPTVRSWTALVLGEIGDPATTRTLIQVAEDRSEDRGVRANAISSLGRMHAEKHSKACDQSCPIGMSQRTPQSRSPGSPANGMPWSPRATTSTNPSAATRHTPVAEVHQLRPDTRHELECQHPPA